MHTPTDSDTPLLFNICGTEGMCSPSSDYWGILLWRWFSDILDWQIGMLLQPTVLLHPLIDGDYRRII